VIPAGALVTVPDPVPASLTVRAKVGVKVAVTAVAAETVTTHVPAPLHPPPLQPVKAEPAAGLAVRVTAVPLAKLAEQIAPQLIPAGLLATVPAPAPAAETVTTHVPAPLHPPPLQPVKAELATGVAVNVTTVPLA